MRAANFALEIAYVLLTIAIFLLAIAVNDWLFDSFEFARGINWVYLPAGIRLLSTLLFGESGAVGLLIASWIATTYYFFPDNAERAIVGAIASALAPWLVYRMARYFWGLHGSLAALTPARLLILSVVYSIASPLMHHLYFAYRGQPELANGFLAMFTGDLLGTLIVLYAAKALLALAPRPS